MQSFHTALLVPSSSEWLHPLLLSSGQSYVGILPAILSALLALKKLWDECLDVNERRDTMNKFTEALNDARTTKDPSKVVFVLNSITGGPGNRVQ